MLFAVVAVCLMWAGSIRCNFLKFDSVSGANPPITMELGIWYYSYFSFLLNTSGAYVYESCNAYPNITAIDATWKAAYSFAIITFIFGVFALVASCVTLCSTNCGENMGGSPNSAFSLCSAKGTSFFYLFVAICQGLVLLFLSSNACNSEVLMGLGGINGPALNGVTFTEKCSMSTGAKLTISATVFWVCAAAASFMAHKAEMSTGEEAVGEEEESAKDTAEKVEEGEAAKVEEGEAAKMAEKAEEGEVDTPEQAVAAAE